MRSALVNETTYIVENIIIADPVTPSPFYGCFMVGLQDPVYETQKTRVIENFPAGTTYVINDDASVTFSLPDGSEQIFPAGTTILIKQDGSIEASYEVSAEVMISQGTPCGIGWIYNPANGTFSEP